MISTLKKLCANFNRSFIFAANPTKSIEMESNDHNQAEIAGPVIFALFLFASAILFIWMIS